MLSTLFCCASCLRLRDQACDFRTSDHPSSECAGSPDTPNTPPSALTTAFACSSTWSIIIGENFRLDLCTITFQCRTPEPSEVVSVKSILSLRREQEYIVQEKSMLCTIYIHRALCSLFQPDTDCTRVSKCRQFSLQRRGLAPMLFQCWSSAVGGGPILKQH